jgi:hypothetical protein
MSGYSQRHASKYSMMRKEEVDIQSFLKHSLCIDTKNLAILSSTSRQSPQSEIHDFNTLLLRAMFLSKIKVVMADKFYDSAKIRQYAEKYEIKPLIPYRAYNDFVALANLGFDVDTYHQRVGVEIVYSTIKRKFGEVVYGKDLTMQQKEAKLIDIVYNVYRYVENYLIWLEDFYRLVAKQ